MFALGRFWRWWTDTWHDPRRARVLYALMAAAFAGLMAAAVVRGDALVATLAGVMMVVALGLVALVPWLSRRTRRGDDASIE